ncbi:ACP S-malonyltransferase [Enterovirga rhinocerotis]|uniref:Malonyl CoA-acyl carrier protein transacylase n=1 Tax=Enterovirga rhinocerotis TaxID=1339210 RepID=A0A4R7BUQ2_9HYPH|nr:ACP S-malonyltransferase [Enterovirga rhinocerotis]TDR89231.1 [acyl-carrier-protein] S-malonyltransferase [Enterovirga rhinocerotis]
MRALIFPGQGSQTVGMGQALAAAFPVAQAVFDEVDSALSQNLSALMWEGPSDELNLTANAQPALMATSLAALRVLESELGLDLARDVALVAGHSLGEYSALAAAGALSISDSARLLRLRGESMQKAVPVGTGAMAAILKLEYDAVRAIAEEASAGEVCDIANDNGAGQVVVSGHKAAVERAAALAQAKGGRGMMLTVSAPFHCRLMAPAAEAMQAALSETTISTPVVPVVANVEAAAISAPEAIRDALVRQVTGTVRWRESVAAMAADGVTDFVEVGAGKVLTGLVKRIAAGARAAPFGQPSDLDAVRPLLGA